MKDGLIRAQRILDRLAQEGVAILVGVSGGVDSMCLMDMVLKSPIDRQNVSVIHVDHNLREDSGRDSQFVQDFCAANSIEIEVFSPDIRAQAKKSGKSIETEARIFRHEVFKSGCQKRAAVLLLAHTASDQAETVLMHIFRGCGMDGLMGMSERDGHIVRPLIYMLRSEVVAYATANNVAFYEDFTNADPSYDRNFVRKLLGDVERRYRGASGSINRLSAIVRQQIPHCNEEHICVKDGAVFLNKGALNTPQKSRYVMAAAKKAGLKTDLEFKHVESVIELSQRQVGKKINLPHGFICANERSSLVFSRSCKNPQEGDLSDKILLQTPFKQGKNYIGGLCVEATPCKNPLKACKIVGECDALGGGIVGGCDVLSGRIVGDCDALSGRIVGGCDVENKKIVVDGDVLRGAVVRFRRSGDVFTPCNGRRKKLKEFLSDKKIENRIKDATPLICSGNEVLVVCGIELSDKAKLTSSTKNALLITVKSPTFADVDD